MSSSTLLVLKDSVISNSFGKSMDLRNSKINLSFAILLLNYQECARKA